MKVKDIVKLEKKKDKEDALPTYELPCGYIDGYNLALQEIGEMEVRVGVGKIAKVICKSDMYKTLQSGKTLLVGDDIGIFELAQTIANQLPEILKGGE